MSLRDLRSVSRAAMFLFVLLCVGLVPAIAQDASSDTKDAAQSNTATSAPEQKNADEVQQPPADGVPSDDPGSATSDGAIQSDDGSTGSKPPDSDASPAGEQATSAANSLASTTTPEAIGVPTKVTLPGASGNGSLTYRIDLDLAPFRGMEPAIALTYDSSRKTKVSGQYQGWLGYGWGLSGFEAIERGSLNYGLPSFTGTDIFMLNGEQLVACGAGVSSPSCSTGGGYATENESYRRIAYIGASNEWRVTDKNGNISLFRSVGAIAGVSLPSGPAYDVAFSYRWLLASVTDLRGNVLSYS